MSINRGTDKDVGAYIRWDFTPVIKKNLNCAICRDLDGPRDCRPVSQKREDTYRNIDTYLLIRSQYHIRELDLSDTKDEKMHDAGKNTRSFGYWLTDLHCTL